MFVYIYHVFVDKVDDPVSRFKCKHITRGMHILRITQVSNIGVFHGTASPSDSLEQGSEAEGTSVIKSPTGPRYTTGRHCESLVWNHSNIIFLYCVLQLSAGLDPFRS